MKAGRAGLLEAVAEHAAISVAEAERTDGERSQGDFVPAIGEQNRVHLLRGYRQVLRAAHTATAFGVACRACRSRSATSVCPLLSASDNGVPPQRSTGWGSVPTARRYLTTSSRPSAAARCRAVRPS